MFIIIQGRVKVTRTIGDAPQTFAELTDGAFFGEMALLSDSPRTANVIAVEDTMLFELSRDQLADVTREYPSVGEVMRRFHKNRLLTNLLLTSPIFAPFTTGDKKGLIERFKSRAVADGTYLVTRERPGDGLYVLLSGRCTVLETDGNGHETPLAELKEGDVFGEMSMLWNKETCASVKAKTHCIVLRLPKPAFQEVISAYPQVLQTLTAMSEKRQHMNDVRRMTEEIARDFIV
jgi:CRP-like cAMP-binding protein